MSYDEDPTSGLPCSRKPDIEHKPGCRLAVGYVRGGIIGALFVWAGGWICPKCRFLKADAVLAHLAVVIDGPVAYIGELDELARRSATRQAQRSPRPGRVIATRRAADALVLAEANLTPRARLLRPMPRRRAIEVFVAALLEGPTPKRVDWSATWRPSADRRTSDPAVRAGMGPADLWAAAVEAAGFRTGIRDPSGLSDVEIAEAIEGHLDRLRAERDGVGWEHRPQTDLDITNHVS